MPSSSNSPKIFSKVLTINSVLPDIMEPKIDKFIEEHMDENTKLIDFKFLPTHNIKILFLFEKTN